MCNFCCAAFGCLSVSPKSVVTSYQAHHSSTWYFRILKGVPVTSSLCMLSQVTKQTKGMTGFKAGQNIDEARWRRPAIFDVEGFLTFVMRGGEGKEK